MTLAFPPSFQAPNDPRRELARNEVRKNLTALLRKRVPQQEIDDVTQTVLCDALAAQTLPTDPEELRRWLTGIARHKIADFHRRSARTNARSSTEAPESIPAHTGASYEDREVLQNLLSEPRTRRDAETMEWLVREHGGERLADIANENGLPAPVVRQRVSRLRRALRSRWCGVFALAVVLAGLSALGISRYDGREAIKPEPKITTVPTAPASAVTKPLSLAKEVEGDWIVSSVAPNRALTPFEQRLLDANVKDASIHIHGGKDFEVTAPNAKITFHVVSVEKAKTASGATRVHLVTESGLNETADVLVRQDARGSRLDITLHGARFGGTVTLRRPIL